MRKIIYIVCALCGFSTANAQKISMVTDVADCGQIVYNRPVTSSFEMQNIGSKPLVIKTVKVSCGCTVVDYPRKPIGVNEKFSVNVTFDSRQMGHFNKLVGIYSNADKEPLILTMRGVVVRDVVDFSGKYPYQMGGLGVDKDNLEYDNVNRGERPVEQLHIINKSNQVLTPNMLHLPPYLSAVVSPSKLAPGLSGTIYLTLDSRKLRDFGLTQTNIYLGDELGDKVSDDNEISVSTVLLPNFQKLTDEELVNAPKLRLSQDSVVLTDIKNKKGKCIIEISNVGRSTLEIRSLQMFTVGLEVSLKDTKLAPGESTKMKITVLTKALKKARTKPRILMITNDPDHGKVMIPVIVK